MGKCGWPNFTFIAVYVQTRIKQACNLRCSDMHPIHVLAYSDAPVLARARKRLLASWWRVSTP